MGRTLCNHLQGFLWSHDSCIHEGVGEALSTNGRTSFTHTHTHTKTVGWFALEIQCSNDNNATVSEISYPSWLTPVHCKLLPWMTQCYMTFTPSRMTHCYVTFTPAGWPHCYITFTPAGWPHCYMTFTPAGWPHCYMTFTPCRMTPLLCVTFTPSVQHPLTSTYPVLSILSDAGVQSARPGHSAERQGGTTRRPLPAISLPVGGSRSRPSLPVPTQTPVYGFRFLITWHPEWPLCSRWFSEWRDQWSRTPPKLSLTSNQNSTWDIKNFPMHWDIELIQSHPERELRSVFRFAPQEFHQNEDCQVEEVAALPAAAVSGNSNLLLSLPHINNFQHNGKCVSLPHLQLQSR